MHFSYDDVSLILLFFIAASPRCRVQSLVMSTNHFRHRDTAVVIGSTERYWSQSCYNSSMKLSILQWNVWYKEVIYNIAKFLKQNPADIVCLQELTINAPDQTEHHTPSYIAAELGFNYHCKELPIESTDGKKMMLANGIFSRFPIIHTD